MPASIKHLTNKKINYYSLLSRWKDGLYYTAVLMKCDRSNKRCFVCFEDGSEVWVSKDDIHIQLSLDQLSEDEDIVCCVCDEGHSESPNEIILCDVCQQGYHQKCHRPPVDSSKIDESDDTTDHKDWFCATCSYILNQSDTSKLGNSASKPQKSDKHRSSHPEKSTSQPQQQQTRSKQPQSGVSSSKAIAPKQSSKPSQVKNQQQDQPKSSPPKPVVDQQPQSTPKPQQQPQRQHQQHSQTQAQLSPQQQPKPQPSPPQQHQQKPPSQPQIQQTKPTQALQQPKPQTQAQQPKQTPYYPLSNQIRAAATSSTAALASMTASSALVVGSSAGRTKQDLVKQSNISSQRQRQQVSGEQVDSTPPTLPKHAVRKSGVNFVVPPVKQSALPTATRSVVPSGIAVVNPVAIPKHPPHLIPNLVAASIAPVIAQTIPGMAAQIQVQSLVSNLTKTVGSSQVGQVSINSNTERRAPNSLNSASIAISNKVERTNSQPASFSVSSSRPVIIQPTPSKQLCVVSRPIVTSSIQSVSQQMNNSNNSLNTGGTQRVGPVNNIELNSGRPTTVIVGTNASKSHQSSSGN